MLPPSEPDRIRIAFDDHSWWPMPGCSFRSPSPSTWVCVSSSSSTLTWEMRRVGRTLETRC